MQPDTRLSARFAATHHEICARVLQRKFSALRELLVIPATVDPPETTTDDVFPPPAETCKSAGVTAAGWHSLSFAALDDPRPISAC